MIFCAKSIKNPKIMPPNPLQRIRYEIVNPKPNPFAATENRFRGIRKTKRPESQINANIIK